MERKIDEWSKSQKISSERSDRTDPPPHPARTEHVNVVFTMSGKSDDPLKIQKDSPPPIIVNNKVKKDKPFKTSKRGKVEKDKPFKTSKRGKVEKDKPFKTSKRGYYVVKTKEYTF
ncbi:hypothetical protein Tco_1241573, partial [Tanacetum coccineum]